jgi:uncharacterized protein (DUF1015 family)
MAGPKADRLKLFQATGMNLSPVFGLFPDADNQVQEQLDRAVGRSLPLEATDHLGVVSRIWPVTDQHVVSKVTGLMGPKPIYIADGHHRYETSLRYLQQRRDAGDVPNEEAAPNFVLMMLVSMSDPGLHILPTHRLISGIPEISADHLRGILEPHFSLELVGEGEPAARETWELIQADGGQQVLGLGTADGAWQLARFQVPVRMAQLAPEHSPAWRGLAVLHILLLGKLLPESLGGQPTCGYVHLLREVTDAIAGKVCHLGVLVPPVGINYVQQIAGNGEKMPPKSTYFYPKLLSGLVLYSLKAI